MFRRQLSRIPAWLIDTLLAVAALIAQLAPFISYDLAPGEPEHWPLVMYLPVIGAALPLIWVRRAPFVALIVCEGALIAYGAFPEGPPQPVWYGPLVAMFMLAALSPRWQRITALVSLAWGALIVTGSVATAVNGTLMWLAAYAMGRAWAARKAHAELLEQQTAMLAERARLLQRDSEMAVENERARIARDMHDILAHGVSIMIAQAEAGPVAIAAGKGERTFQAISTAGREAMGQLRRILGVLTTMDEAPAPAPTLADLPTLAERTSVPVVLRQTGQPHPLTPDTEVAVYRIVQESLTNVVKHSGAGEAQVALHWTDGALRITITDDGDGAPAITPQRSGHGLVGIRERARAYGGTVQSGPRTDGVQGFQVMVTI